MGLQGDQALPEFPIVPTDLNRLRANWGFTLFNEEHPEFPTKDICYVIGSGMRFSCALAKAFLSPNASSVYEEIFRRSINEPEFNDKYKDVYKYVRQAAFNQQWEKFNQPLIDIGGIHGFKSYKKLLRFMSPTLYLPSEVLPPPATLFPWPNKDPEAMEILENDFKSYFKLDESLLKEILAEVLQKPTKVPTLVDFLVKQTNNKKVLNLNSLSEVNFNSKVRPTAYKYEGVTSWIDKGMPKQEFLGIRTRVYKGPGETRDATTVNASLLYEVWLLNTLIDNSVNHKGYVKSMGLKDLRAFTKLKDQLNYIHTDWSKSGLTMPHKFMELLIDRINEISPVRSNFPVNGWPIIDYENKKVIRPLHGYGYSLGMINNAYTLFNIVLFEYAKRTGILEPEAAILSFNDDMVVRTERRCYYQYLELCHKSGGYLDEFKSFNGKGPMFCEVHQLSQLWNTKWFTWSNTLWSTFYKSRNVHHFRFYLSDVWSAITETHEDVAAHNNISSYVAQTIEHYIIKCSEAYWGKEFNTSISPELGGLFNKRGVNGLKTNLTWFESNNVEDHLCELRHLMVYKNMTSSPLVFRPWKKFPRGKTHDLFEYLGQFDGLHFELKIFKDRINNKFNNDSKFTTETYWDEYSTKLKNSSVTEYDYYRICREFSHWTEEIPEILVTKYYRWNGNSHLPFMRMKTNQPNVYSIQSSITRYIDFFKKENKFPEINEKLISLSNISDFVVPIVHEDKPIPEIDMLLQGQLSNFADPRIAYVDYKVRRHCVIQAMDYPDKKSESTLNLLRKLNPNDQLLKRKDLVGIWWTQNPLVMPQDKINILRDYLPIDHEDLIAGFWMNTIYNHIHKIPEETTVLAVLSKNRVWANKLKRNKTKNTKKKLGVTGEIEVQPNLSAIQMEDVFKLFKMAQQQENPPPPGEEITIILPPDPEEMGEERKRQILEMFPPAVIDTSWMLQENISEEVSSDSNLLDESDGSGEDVSADTLARIRDQAMFESSDDSIEES